MAYAKALIDAVESNRVPRQDLTAATLDEKLGKIFEKMEKTGA